MNKRNINTIVMVEDENGDIYTHNIPENAYAVIFDGVQKLVEPKYLQLLPDEITEEAFDHRGIALRVTITKDRMAFCTHQQRGTRMYDCSKNPLCDGVEKAVLYALCLDRNPKVVCLLTDEELGRAKKLDTITVYTAE